MPDRKTVMISSTARDLPEHRKEAMDACLRQGMFPMMMEHLPASDADAISCFAGDGGSCGHLRRHLRASLRLRAGRGQPDDLRHRDGVQPGGRTQDPAPDLRHGQGPPDHIDRCGDRRGRDQARSVQEAAPGDKIVNFFKSPADLRALVINSLSQRIASPTSRRSTTSATSPRRPRRTSRTRTPSCRRTGWSAGRRSSIC